MKLKENIECFKLSNLQLIKIKIQFADQNKFEYNNLKNVKLFPEKLHRNVYLIFYEIMENNEIPK